MANKGLANRMVQYRAPLIGRLEAALAARADLLDDQHEAALRLFSGFYEGWPALVFDLYGRTLVIHNYADDPAAGRVDAERGLAFYQEHLPWLAAAVLKTRRGATSRERSGVSLLDGRPDHWIREEGVRYAVDLQLNRDASFYLDTRELRAWLRANADGLDVLNTFAYSGSLGVAAVAGGATRVVHTDLNKGFLNLAKTSYTLNGFPIDKKKFQAGDFWSQASRFKRAGERFDLVILDPPFFSTTNQGTVNLAENYARLINKLRPLIRSGGRLVATNNALFVSGREFLSVLEALGHGGYVEIEQLIPVPLDVTGTPATIVGSPPVDPAPFNHPTKIVVLRIYHEN